MVNHSTPYAIGGFVTLLPIACRVGHGIDGPTYFSVELGQKRCGEKGAVAFAQLDRNKKSAEEVG